MAETSHTPGSSSESSGDERALVAEANALTAQLALLQRNPRKRKIPWRDVAIAQANELQMVLHENKRLKEALSEHTRMAHALQKAMVQAQEFQLEEWKCHRLPSDSARWKDGLQKMLAEDHDHTNSHLIRHGLCDAVSEVESTQVRRHADGSVAAIDKLTHVYFPHESIASLAKVCTELLTTEVGRATIISGTQWQRLQPIDSSLVDDEGILYLSGDAKVPTGPSHGLHGHIAIQRFVEPARVVFVFRSVLEDQRYPLEYGNVPKYAHNEVGWLVMEPSRRQRGVSVKSIVTCTPNLYTPPMCPFAARGAPPILQPLMRGCVNMYRQPNRSVTELLVRGLVEKNASFDAANPQSGVSGVDFASPPTIHIAI
ncbi:hypothetical protein SDRG_10798 [Saprolegnia diclina VS20]|uniref:Uncharacterized protein n=1 Tax=Saprolegnia diclina (strain VS20) TaxID=1156394 RepID=T0RH43_SAPDV|nr:hypothetical protein SDRG_10798 [Saprolegnia diclina VS20]EQC31633.1 hypothetical protein SDRG_10798 [Saprolegnia diclina VS20]|eukprot:XP_008615032.1 hypothetical protein SDRG_10798 [Saprolegnia diclina VS20]